MSLRSICLSHSPFIGHVHPPGTVEEDVRAQLSGLADQVTEYDPELILLVAPDHFNGFFYDMMPPFCIGVRADGIGDYGTPSGPINVPEAKALWFVEQLGAAGFDVTVSYKMQVDHAFSQPLAALAGSLQRYPTIPVFLNSAAPPRPGCGRVRSFGEALGAVARRADARVLLIGSGGLSHDPPVPSISGAAPDVEAALIGGRDLTPERRQTREERTMAAGQRFAAGESELRALNADWDREVLSILRDGALDRFDRFGDEEITERGGRAGHEIRTWIAVFAAQAAAGPYRMKLHYHELVPEWLVSMAIATAEPA